MSNSLCFFVSDLHGSIHRYEELFKAILKERPGAVFMGGDLLPSGMIPTMSMGVTHNDFIGEYLTTKLEGIRKELGPDSPRVFMIFGNDDPRFEESSLLFMASKGLCEYIHNRSVPFGEYTVTGYSFVPPTPFLLKDWERYDVSRFVDPGCVSPEEGRRSVPVSENESRYSTIKEDLEKLTSKLVMNKSIFLFHSPPYQTKLDRADLDGKFVDYAPLDVHVGSIAIQRFIGKKQPFLTLHGHVHESAEITGHWQDKIEETHMFSAAHRGPELSLVRFDVAKPEAATRELL